VRYGLWLLRCLVHLWFLDSQGLDDFEGIGREVWLLIVIRLPRSANYKGFLQICLIPLRIGEGVWFHFLGGGCFIIPAVKRGIYDGNMFKETPDVFRGFLIWLYNEVMSLVRYGL